jgi:alpha-methylacyl-CoA racemase
MTDGSASLMGVFYGMLAAGIWRDERGANLLDSGAHFYDTYETADGKYVAIGAIEPHFYRALLEKTGIADPEFEFQMDRAHWPSLKEKLAAVFKTKTREEWDTILLGSDVCYAPVLSLHEAPKHPHNAARGTFVDIDGVTQPAPAPRFSRTPPEVPHGPRAVDTEGALSAWGFSGEQIEALKRAEAI